MYFGKCVAVNFGETAAASRAPEPAARSSSGPATVTCGGSVAVYFGVCVAVSFGETAATFQGAGPSGQSVTVTNGVSVTAVASRAQKPAARSSSGAARPASAAVSQVPAAWVLWVPYLGPA